MSAPSSWLQKQRKSDLQGLAEQVGLKDYENLKKTELEYALDEHMRANQTRLSKDTNFEAFYKRVQSAASPVKKAAVSLVTPDDAAKEKKPRARRSIKAREEIELPPDSSSSEEAATTTAAALLARTPRAVTNYVSSLELPPSPSLVADQIDAQTASLRSSLHSLWSHSGILEKAESLRETLSSVTAIETLALALEAYGLRAEVLPMSYVATVPAVDALGTPRFPVRVPDLFALLNMSFWAPVTLWLVTGVVLPLAGAYFFNLTRRAAAAAAARGRRGGGLVDPLAFNVARALLAWLVYAKGVTGGWASPVSVGRVEGSVPGGWRGMCVGAGVGGLMSVYEAVLRK